MQQAKEKRMASVKLFKPSDEEAAVIREANALDLVSHLRSLKTPL